MPTRSASTASSAAYWTRVRTTDRARLPLPAEGTTFADPETASAEVLVQVMLETPAGIANAEEIAAVDGVDMIAIGVADFTAELGAVGDVADLRVHAAVATVGRACRAHDKLMMVSGIADDAVYRALLPLGVWLVPRSTGPGTDSSRRRTQRLHDEIRVTSPIRQSFSSTIGVSISPRPSIRIRTTSPPNRKAGGFCIAPVPGTVPV